MTGVQTCALPISRLYRWLAFMYVGGGLYTEYDVLPGGSFTSENIPEPDAVNLLEKDELSAVSSDRRGLGFLVEVLLEHNYNTLTVPSDKDILRPNTDVFWRYQHDVVKPWNTDKWSEAALVHFSSKACKTAGASTSKYSMMLQHAKALKPA